ncbi:MAG: hypothetical protein IKR60_03200 [Alphaproteobacteria bacterium]|nr:hypothetical protein [Alphaproteobacteria bacterium]
MQKDFSYPLKIDELSQKEQRYALKADKAQLAVIKDILKVEDVKSFEADIILKLSRKAHRLDIEGEVKALIELKSVISLENFERLYCVPFAYYYDTQMTYQDWQEMDFGLSDDAPEIIENGRIDLGAVALEQLALVLEDYPRQEGENFEFVSEFDDETTKRANPFTVLEKLKK